MTLSALVVGILEVPGLPRPTKADAVTQNPRLCSGVATSGIFTGNGQQKIYDLYVPQGAAVTLAGTVDTPHSDWRVAFTVNPFGGWDLAGGHASYGGTWTNNGASGYVEVRLDAGNVGNVPESWQFTVTVGGASGACLDPKNTLGPQCAGQNLGGAQGLYGDPVNAATGNFHESFADFAIPGRGPGLALSHSYNSLVAPTSSGLPLGYGWTYSYGMSLAVAAGVVTVTQESGATLPFYPLASGGFTTPPWAVATLVQNGNGYAMTRCHDLTFQFSSTGRLDSISDRDGYATTLQYDASGNLSTVTDSAGRQLHVYWTGSHITSVTDSSTPPRTVSFGYNDGAGNLTDYTDAGGASWKFGYNGRLLTTIRRPRQANVPNAPVTTNQYDAQNRVFSQTDELLRETRFDYTTIANSTKITDPKGNVVVEEYHGGVRTKLTRGSAPTSTWLFEYDGTLGVTKVTDPNNHVTTASYDADGNRLSLRDPLGHGPSATYNAYDQPATTTDANGVVTTYNYDPNRPWLLTSESTPVGGQTRLVEYGLDPAHPGDIITVKDPSSTPTAPRIWRRTYDPSTGYLLSETSPPTPTSPQGDTTFYGYDRATGWLTVEVSPRGNTVGMAPDINLTCAPPALGCMRFAHDLWGHVTTTTDGNGHQSTDHYDLDGNRDYTIDADFNRTDFVYDAADQLTTVQRADLTTLVTHYWPDGSVKDTVDGATKTTAYAYDTQGRLTSTTDPDLRVTNYGYDPAGNVVSKADPGGTCPAWTTTWPPTLSTTAKCTVMAYDIADRLTQVKYSDGVTPNVTAIGYDDVGRRTSMTDGSGTSSWTWDALGRVKTATNGAGKTVTYIYANTRDPATTVNYPGRGDVTRTFDEAGRLATVQDWLGKITTFTPDADSNLAGASSPAGAGLGDAYAPFDNADQLNGIAAKANGATVAGFSYDRYNSGQLKSVTTTGLSDTHAYGYTKLQQLKTVDGATVYGYDAADNIIAMPGVALAGYSNANQLGAATRGTGVTTFGFDTRGNRTSAAPAAAVRTDYSYDQANRLTSVDTTTWSALISAGWYHSLAARADGTTTAWGLNNTGQIGDNSNVNRSSPTAVPGLTGVTAVAAGMQQSYALKADGTVWAWGWN